jgi:U-box domain
MEMMEDPVMDLCAHSFERRAVLDWLATGNACCPISRKPLQKENLIPNHALAERIDTYMWHKEHHHENWLIVHGNNSQDDDEEMAMRTSRSSDETSDTVATNEQDGIVMVGRNNNKNSRQQHKKGRNHSHFTNKLRNQDYTAVPIMLLLPQEREMMKRVRMAADADREALKKRFYCRLIWGVIGTVSIVLVAVAAMQFFSHQEQSEDDGDV